MGTELLALGIVVASVAGVVAVVSLINWLVPAGDWTRKGCPAPKSEGETSVTTWLVLF